MRPDPTVGQVWKHKDGTIRKVLRMSETRSPSWPDLHWQRMDILPGPGFGECSIKTWDRWARNAEIVPPEAPDEA
jgi:hypothetical protein